MLRLEADAYPPPYRAEEEMGTIKAAAPDARHDEAFEDEIVAAQAQLQWRRQRLNYRRSEARHKGVITEAILMWRSKSLRVEVENLSRSGVMISFEGPLAVGEDVQLEFDGQGSLSGSVHWVREGRAGIALEENAIELVIYP